MATRDEVVAEALSWEGTRFSHQGRVKGAGVDCINLVIGTAINTGLLTQEQLNSFDIPEARAYGRSPNGELLMQGCDHFLDRIPFSAVKKGDILIFKFVDEPQHFAIVTSTNPLYMVHAYAHDRKVVHHGFNDVWKQRLVACFRFRGIQE
jgi:NlpC/P60 family putative phage cell wall peptidase